MWKTYFTRKDNIKFIHKSLTTCDRELLEKIEENYYGFIEAASLLRTSLTLPTGYYFQPNK